MIEQRFPAGPPVEITELIEGVRPERQPLKVGDERVISFLVAFARKLLKPSVARRFPELASLGFFLRRVELEKAVARLGSEPGQLRFGRGLVFHVPPANVDTIFVYSWALSALAGNPNIVRISSRSAGAATVILDALNETLAEADPIIAQTQRMVTYGRDDKVTAALSAACDLRVIWGGDRSVHEIRKHPLAPAARDLTFPDRASFSVISAAGWHAASAEERKGAAEGCYNDAYWFDQAACSSPRTIFWIGEESQVSSARAEFRTLLEGVLTAKQPLVDPAMAVEKRVATYGMAIEGEATGIHFTGNALATVDLARPETPPRRWLGVGTFPEARLGSLSEMASLVVRRDQTVTHFGFGEDDLLAFANELAGRGVDRIVPLGQALDFAAIWDGYDLPREFTRLVTVKTR
ncbi:acyl-CoA reductase [Longispora albida]|uniref:acyl-CoA reductase n=1 Tax=Longispora albida TaxID=203523 RepID=UPI000376251C|nr:acyl-CoA reductase [Longispora albida]